MTGQAMFHPLSCPLVQWQRAIDAALDLAYDELMSGPVGERPVRVLSLGTAWRSMQVRVATATEEEVALRVHAYVPVLWHELALVTDKRSDRQHRLPLLRGLNERLRRDGLWVASAPVVELPIFRRNQSCSRRSNPCL